MNNTEIITKLCEITAEIAEVREHLAADQWQLDAELREVQVRLQLAMKRMQG